MFEKDLSWHTYVFIFIKIRLLIFSQSLYMKFCIFQNILCIQGDLWKVDYIRSCTNEKKNDNVKYNDKDDEVVHLSIITLYTCLSF